MRVHGVRPLTLAPGVAAAILVTGMIGGCGGTQRSTPQASTRTTSASNLTTSSTSVTRSSGVVEKTGPEQAWYAAVSASTTPLPATPHGWKPAYPPEISFLNADPPDNVAEPLGGAKALLEVRCSVSTTIYPVVSGSVGKTTVTTNSSGLPTSASSPTAHEKLKPLRCVNPSPNDITRLSTDRAWEGSEVFSVSRFQLTTFSFSLSRPAAVQVAYYSR